jgi:uncharacterized SAM-binding protein YcdF (DUF218 family)
MTKRPRREEDTQHRRRWSVALALILAVVFAAVTARLFIWPPLVPLPERADAIIELAGSADGRRDSRALELAREHRAAYLVQSTTITEAGTHRCLPAVPEVTVLCFHADPSTTRGEAQFIATEGERRGWKSVILVTTPDQAWRARLWTSRCFAGDVFVATTDLPPLNWFRQIPYQWAASAKAMTVQRSCW